MRTLLDVLGGPATKEQYLRESGREKKSQPNAADIFSQLGIAKPDPVEGFDDTFPGVG